MREAMRLVLQASRASDEKIGAAPYEPIGRSTGDERVDAMKERRSAPA